MADLLDTIKANRTHSGPRCTIERENLPKPVAADLAKALADKTLSTAEIARALQALGYKIRDFNLGRHRRGECGCTQ